MEDFVTYELAVKLKEKGFRRPCILYYNSDKVRTWFNEPYTIIQTKLELGLMNLI